MVRPMGETIRIQAAPGDTDTYLAPARPSPGPGVMLLHTWWGLNETMRDLADRMAGDGFTVMAPDLFDGKVLTTIEDADAWTTAIEQGDDQPSGLLTPDRIMGRVQATLDHLLAHSDVSGERVGIVALSFGGWYGSHVASERNDVAAFVAIYSDVYGPPGGAAYLGHFAADDRFVDATPVSDMQTALPAGSAAYVYPGTNHWFMEPDRPEYDVDAAETAYARTVSFLREWLAG